MRILLIVLCAVVTAAHAQDSLSPLPTEEIRFGSGDFTLVGDLVTPDGVGPHATIVYVWGSGPTDRARHIERSRILRSFVDAGFAVFLYDKPGSGSSTGEFDRSRLLTQRAEILKDALATLRRNPAVRSDAIGLYGSSQASYVMAVALAEGCDPAFVVAWSCPMQNSLEQSAYLVRNYLLCAGRAEDEARAAEEAFVTRRRARDYAEYVEAARRLDALPEIRDELGWAGVLQEEAFRPTDPSSESFLDPARLLEERGGFGMPVLSLYAENDRQIDPVQGAAVCRRLLGDVDDGLSRVVVIPGADHNMILSPRGCMQDQTDGYAAVGGATVSPVFLENVVDWLRRVRVRFGDGEQGR